MGQEVNPDADRLRQKQIEETAETGTFNKEGDQHAANFTVHSHEVALWRLKPVSDV